jgi:hypothetical protein
VTAVVACACLGGCAAGEEVSRGDRERVAAVVAKGEAARAAVREDTAPRETTTRIVVTRDDPGLPAACRPRRLARHIAGFFGAFNRGDPSAVDFVDPSEGWYSVSDGRGRHFVTYSRSGLPEYFARRHRRGERLRLLEVDVSYARGLGHMAYRVERRAGDLARLGIVGTTAVGKGALDCETGKIVVWSMGQPAGQRFTRFAVCPRPTSRTGAIVACARRGG